jgi:hypothetical protein
MLVKICHINFILSQLLSRVLDSYRASVKSKKTCEGYTTFASNMCANAFSNIFPGSSKCRRSFALQALCQIREILVIEEPWIEVWKTQMTDENVDILLGCLSDTYDANKKMALGLLKSFPSDAISINVIYSIFCCVQIANFQLVFSSMI